MASIFGAGLLDILNQGGQFMAGRQAGQRDRAVAEEERKQQKALEEALLAQRQAQTAETEARTQGLLNPAPDEVNWTYDSTRGVQVHPRTGEVRAPQGLPEGPPRAPVLGTPEYLKAQKDLADARRLPDEPEGPPERFSTEWDRVFRGLERSPEWADVSYAELSDATDKLIRGEQVRSPADLRRSQATPDSIMGAMRGASPEAIQRALANAGLGAQATAATAPTPVAAPAPVAPPAPVATQDDVGQEIAEAQEAVAAGMPAETVWGMMSPVAQAQLGDPSGLGR